jgi:hypothetical protein
VLARDKPYRGAMIVNLAFTLVFNTSLFPDDLRTWQARATAENTWTQFKVDVTTARPEFRLNNQTAQQSGFHSANMMIENNHEGTLQGTADAI